MAAAVKLDVPEEREIFVFKFANAYVANRRTARAHSLPSLTHRIASPHSPPPDSVLGKAFGKDQAMVKEYLTKMGAEDHERTVALQTALQTAGVATIGPLADGREVEVQAAMIASVTKKTIKVHERKFIPSVVEPSFGIGRILYAVLEHCFYVRQDEEKRTVMRFNAEMAPVKCTVFPLTGNKEYDPVVEHVSQKLRRHGITQRVDTTSTTIGKRYARTDEIGVPFAVTLDPDTLHEAKAADGSYDVATVTLRERDSMRQVRLPIADVAATISDLARGLCEWDDLTKKYPMFEAKE